MNFSKIAQQLNEENPALSVERVSGERAVAGGETQRTRTNQRKDRQKAQMAAQQSVPTKSDVSYTSEEARQQREYEKMWHNSKSDWRNELIEAAKPDDEGNHPYVDVMPFLNQKQVEAKRQEKGLAKMEAGSQAKMAEEVLTEVRKSEKLGKGNPDKRNALSPTGYTSSVSDRKRKGAMGGRTHLSGGQPYNKSERGKKKNEPGSQHQRLNPPAKPKTRLTKNQLLTKAMGYGSGRYQGD